MYLVFANTGVQTICHPLPKNLSLTTDNIGFGWQRCVCLEDGERVEFPYIQWQILQAGSGSRLFLAIDTTCGEEDEEHQDGYFQKEGTLLEDFAVTLSGLLGVNGEILPNLEEVSFTIRPAAAKGGDPKDVHMVVDFGNSRTGSVLLEVSRDSKVTMTPFELRNRYQSDAWDENGNFVKNYNARWFSSRTLWCTPPYLPAPEIRKVVPADKPKKKTLKIFGGQNDGVEIALLPSIFQDHSMVRMGCEADDVGLVVRTAGDAFRTGVSSPKRYLWASDGGWLDGANWHMADPYDRHATKEYCVKLEGPLLKYISEDDQDGLLDNGDLTEFESALPRPRHAPRTLMIAAIYELLCQAYTFVNSQEYLQGIGDASRMRVLRTLTLTFPTGMIQDERERLRRQCHKAIRIFQNTLGRKANKKEIDLTLSIDEASAVHLTYIWSELRMLGQKAGFWFDLMSRERLDANTDASSSPEPKESSPRRPGARPRKQSRSVRENIKGARTTKELRIACIDIGGGTTDLMIAKYSCASGIEDRIRGEILHRDGVSLAGDQLVKRLLEKIIVPRLADALALDDEDVHLLFGPEVPHNLRFRAQRISWINGLFVPLAQAYLNNCVDNVDDEISQCDEEVVSPEVLDSLDQVINDIRGPGYYDINQELGLRYEKDEFDNVVYEVFDDLLFDFCSRIVEFKVDIVLLAGQPSKLKLIQEIVQAYLPLPASRVIPMHNHYAGNWYPYQSEDGLNPGIIVDPKSAVVVGAAIEFLARNGWLPQFRFDMDEKSEENSYYWGVMTDATSGFNQERGLFKRLESSPESKAKTDRMKFETSARRVIIGRKMGAADEAQATPVYIIEVDTQDRMGRIDVEFTLERTSATKSTEETIELVNVEGDVAGEPAVLGTNVRWSWRTLLDERYYLDTGGLDNIEIAE